MAQAMPGTAAQNGLTEAVGSGHPSAPGNAWASLAMAAPTEDCVGFPSALGHLTRAKHGAATRSAQLTALVPDGECLPCSAGHPRETLRTDSEPAVRAGSRSELLATLTTGGIFLTPSCGSLTRTQCEADAARMLGPC